MQLHTEYFSKERPLLNRMMNIYPLLGKDFTCPSCGKKHTISVKKVVIRAGAVDEISAFVTSLIGNKRKLLIIADNISDPLK